MFAPLQGPHYATNTRAVCIGSGRFIRAVLVPIFRSLENSVIVAQTRGTSFASACVAAKGKYEVDTIGPDGHVDTSVFELEAVGSLGVPEGRAAFLKLPAKLPQLKYIGFGVTEAGLQPNSQAINHLTEFLQAAFESIPDNDLSIINTDNFPNNGDHIKKLVRALDWVQSDASAAFRSYLNNKVHFHNTMVDRITNHRTGDPLVPLTEPWPAKALVIEDLHGLLDTNRLLQIPGVHIRTNKLDIAKDYLLKFSLGNAINSAMVYLLALSRQRTANQFHHFPMICKYLDQLFEKDILPALLAGNVAEEQVRNFYAEWLERMKHPHFGLDTFWVSQNALLRLYVRLLHSVNVNVAHDNDYRPSNFMAFATAIALRFLTPSQVASKRELSTIFVGQMDPIQENTPIFSLTEKTWTYDSGLTANLSTGKYEFDDGENGRVSRLLWRASQHVLKFGKGTNGNPLPSTEVSSGVGVAVASVLSGVQGFDLTNDVYASFAADVAGLYQRLISGKQTALETLEDVLRNHDTSEYLKTKEEVAIFVRTAVASVEIIDVHTHLFPPSHGNLMLWGINELLTYHYLVAEFLQTSTLQVEAFNSYPKEEQAVLIWQHLFVDRSPVSEACRGVLTTLHLLGLDHLVAKRDIVAIQEWFKQQNPEEYVDTVFRLAGLKYAVMTNIPFEPQEARHWLGDPATNTPHAPLWSRKYFRSALRVDQILLGDWTSIGPTLEVFTLPRTLAGVRTLLEKWIEIMQPEYFMASVPISFKYTDESAPKSATGALPDGAELLLQVLLPLAEETKLPIALKFDSVRPINARYGVAGDGVKPSNVDILIKLCNNFPRVKFLATFLSRVNQHEVTVTANKFRNLHLYGCWWYCNNPSIIEELTRMRIEILGTAFTSQHSDARVLDQLIYKWSHSREVIGSVLVDMYEKLFATGWKVSKSDIERDVQRLFGQSYEEFMEKPM